VCKAVVVDRALRSAVHLSTRRPWHPGFIPSSLFVNLISLLPIFSRWWLHRHVVVVELLDGSGRGAVATVVELVVVKGSA
jgi:hypothetical protein